MEDLQRFLDARAEAWNTTPQEELGELSPEQVSSLIYSRWEENSGPIHIVKGLPLAKYEESPFFRNTRHFLQDLAAEGAVKLTATGNLPRSFVATQAERFRDSEYHELLQSVAKVTNERDVFYLHISRIVSELAGVLVKRKGTLSVKKNALPLLAESAADALAARLFLAFFRKFNLEYLTPTQFEFQGLQARLAYSFYRLQKSGCDSIPVEQLPKLLLLDPDQGLVENFSQKLPTYWTPGKIVLHHLIEPMVCWGLVEKIQSKPTAWSETAAIRGTPLFQNIIAIHLT